MVDFVSICEGVLPNADSYDNSPLPAATIRLTVKPTQANN